MGTETSELIFTKMQGSTIGSDPSLYWLPTDETWPHRLKSFSRGEDASFDAAVALANVRLDFVRTAGLDSAVRKRFTQPPADLATKPVKLAVLGSSTLTHLHAAIRVAGLRRGIWVETYEGDYGQYLQELLDPRSALHAFAPTAVLFAFDAEHATRGVDTSLTAAEAAAAVERALERITRCWTLAREAFDCPILQQTIVNTMPPLLGSNEHRLPGSPWHAVERVNSLLREAADAERVDLVAVDACVVRDGLRGWCDPALWHRAKQEILPTAAPVWGDLVARLLAAKQGRSFKCLVLDLDNTIWGGVIGDDGMSGIILGQGDPLGEGFLAVQKYARELAQRGVILAVCSKNDEANALEPFENHPEMVLRLKDIAAFRANWDDKVANLRALAHELNIGLDLLVFLDDSPFERTLVRRELPMVAVPEVPDEPALVPQLLADAGYFEGICVTGEDRERTQHYQTNKARDKLMAASTDVGAYLRALDMRLIWSRFDAVGLQRIVQLINRTNQFNLTTRRYGESDVVAVMNDPNAFGLQLRLVDCFGDNGIIAIVIGRMQRNNDLLIDTWLMSCRVLGWQVEPTTLNLVAAEAKRLGARRLIGEYVPTKKNGMVAEHYRRLGFSVVETYPDGRMAAAFDLARFEPTQTFIAVEERQSE